MDFFASIEALRVRHAVLGKTRADAPGETRKL